jgi:hypothetical protein
LDTTGTEGCEVTGISCVPEGRAVTTVRVDADGNTYITQRYYPSGNVEFVRLWPDQAWYVLQQLQERLPDD